MRDCDGSRLEVQALFEMEKATTSHTLGTFFLKPQVSPLKPHLSPLKPAPDRFPAFGELRFFAPVHRGVIDSIDS